MTRYNTIFLSVLIALIPQITLAEDQIAAKIKQYISNIQSVAIEFEQSDSRGNTAKGLLVIDKPYKFRCNYYPPYPLLIIGNKNYVSVYDFEMEHLTRIKADENVFYFLLVDKINFDNKFKIIATEEVNNTYRIKLTDPDLGRTSQIVFDKSTGNIKSMQIFEENNTISITFSAPQIIKEADSDLFLIQDPDIFGEPARLNKEQLQKKYKNKL